MLRLIALIFCLAAAHSALAADQPAVSRILRVIDFEERQLGNTEDLPMHWTKVSGAGMPHYINGRLSNDLARSGKYSFRFDLNGGSLVYRYDPVPVQPRSFYRVEAFARTSVLPNARARMTAYFIDQDQRPLMASMKRSQTYAASSTDADWHRLAIELESDTVARWLVVELELLQPALYASSTLGEQVLFPQDFRGTAWFDDVTISQVPKVKLSTDRPGNVFRRGEALTLQVMVTDRSTDDLAGQLVVRDAAGKIVFQRSGALDITGAENLGPGRKQMRLVLPELPPGWYETALVMTSGGQFVGRQTLDLIQLADNAADPRPDDRFGVIATDLPFDGWSELPRLLPLLGAGRVKLAVWSSAGDIQQSHSAEFDQLLVHLAEQGITPTACLVDLPPDVAAKVPGGWLALPKARVEDWQPQLAYMISRHANHLDRWQLGADGSDAFVTQKQMRQVYALVYGEFAKLMQKPDLAMPWPAWADLEGELPATVAMSVHPSVLPMYIPLYMHDIRKHEGHNLSLTLQLLDRSRYGRELQIRDLAQRMIYALAADARRIDIPLPFTVARGEEGWNKEPQELLMIVRTLTTTLGGAKFQGKVPIAEGVEAFLFEKNGQGVLALWDRGQGGGVKQLALTLGERARAIDLWGNVTPLFSTGANGRPTGQVQLTIGPMPIFLVDIDGALAQLRASVAFDQPLIESSFEPHRRRIRFTNPYRTAISGTLKLKAPEGWTLTPPVFSFNVNPNETFERELTIEFPYNSFAGPKTIEAQFTLQDGRISGTTVPITLNLGLSDVGMQTLAIRDGDDVLVQQIITNYGGRPIDYNAFAMFPGHARQERLVTNLGPGRTTIKFYKFAQAKAENARVRTGVKELMGTRILNDEVEVR